MEEEEGDDVIYGCCAEGGCVALDAFWNCRRISSGSVFLVVEITYDGRVCDLDGYDAVRMERCCWRMCWLFCWRAVEGMGVWWRGVGWWMRCLSEVVSGAQASYDDNSGT